MNNLKLGDVYLLEDRVYYKVIETNSDGTSKSIPLSRWILCNYKGDTEKALEIFKDMASKAKVIL